MPDGRLGRICEIAASTSSVLLIMSRPQPKSTEICAEPRELAERTSSTPGTERMASSTGRVTSKAVWSAGRLPASRSTTTRGNATCGNSPTGSETRDDHAGDRQGERHQQDRAGVPLDERGEVHCALLACEVAIAGDVLMRTGVLSESW